MEKHKTFSIIIPIYNKELYLQRCLSSIVSQSYSDFEAILIDDGSNDLSKQVVSQFLADTRFSYYFHENRGVSYTRNRGLEMACGEYVLFIDADDAIEKNFLSNLWKYIKDKPETSLFIFSLTKVYQDGRYYKLPLPFHSTISMEQFKASFMNVQEQSGIYGFVANKLIKREFLSKNKIFFDTEKKLAEDLDFFVRCYRVVDHITFIDEFGYLYYQETLGSSVWRAVNYLSLIGTYLNIYNWIQNTSHESNKIIQIKIVGLVKCLFIEMQYPTYKNIKDNADLLLENKEIYALLQGCQNDIVLLLLKRKNYQILLYYLLLRKKILYAKLCIIRSWRQL